MKFNPILPAGTLPFLAGGCGSGQRLGFQPIAGIKTPSYKQLLNKNTSVSK